MVAPNPYAFLDRAPFVPPGRPALAGLTAVAVALRVDGPAADLLDPAAVRARAVSRLRAAGVAAEAGDTLPTADAGRAGLHLQIGSARAGDGSLLAVGCRAVLSREALVRTAGRPARTYAGVLHLSADGVVTPDQLASWADGAVGGLASQVGVEIITANGQ